MPASCSALLFTQAIEIAMTNPDNLDTSELNALEVKLRTKLGQIFYEMEVCSGLTCCAMHCWAAMALIRSFIAGHQGGSSRVGEMHRRQP